MQMSTTARGCKNREDNPLWTHVEILSIPAGGGGNKRWRCKYCNKVVIGSYSKVRGHLLRIGGLGVEPCKELSPDVSNAIKREHEVAEQRKARLAAEARQRQAYVSLPSGSDLVQPKKKRGALELSFNMIEREDADKDCALMFYTGALSFNFARNPFFKRYSQRLANGSLAGYTPPTYDRLRTTLLAQSKGHIQCLLQPIRDSWKKKGCSICSDGWSDRQSRPIINIMVASAAGPMFIKGIDSSQTLSKDADYIASLFTEAIEHVGPENVVQVVTDNAGNFKAAGALIEAKYNHIFWTPCVVHCLNLVIKAICEPPENSPQYAECKWIKDLVTDLHNVNYFIANHGLSRTIFDRYSSVKLLKVAETRFASNIVMATRMKKVKEALEKTVMDPDWKKFKVNGKSPVEVKAREVKDLLVSDTWWDRVDYLLNFTEPMMEFLRVGDKDSNVLHLVYDMWDTMIEKVKGVIFNNEGKDLLTDHSSFFDAIHMIMEARWNKSNTPLHCLAHSLVPKYYTEDWLQGGSSGVRRIAPNEDEEVATNRDKCFAKLFTNPADIQKVYSEYGAFSCGLEYFGQPHVLASRAHSEPLSWWATYGAAAPLLQSLAFKLLAQPASSSCCERNWSTYGSIQSVQRNRLTSSRTEDLVYVHNNMRLLCRKQEEYAEGSSKFWDIGGDALDGGDSLLKMAALSLNDPEIEAMTFDL